MSKEPDLDSDEELQLTDQPGAEAYIKLNIDHTSRSINRSISQLFKDGKYDEAIALGEDRVLDFGPIKVGADEYGQHDDEFLRHGIARCYYLKAINSDIEIQKKEALLKKAAMHLEAGLAHSANDIYCAQLLGTIYDKLGRSEEAIALFTKITESHPEELPFILPMLCKLYLKTGDYVLAENMAHQLIRRIEQAPEGEKHYIELSKAITMLARTQINQNNANDAQENVDQLFEIATKIEDESRRNMALAISWGLQSDICKLRKDFKGAEEAINKNLECISKVQVGSWRNKAENLGLLVKAEVQWLLRKMDDVKATANQILAVAENRPKSPMRTRDISIAYRFIAQAEQAGGHYEDAEAAARKSLEVLMQGPHHADHDKHVAMALGVLASCFIRQGKIPEAREVIGRLDGIEPKSVHVLLMSARADIAEGRAAEAAVLEIKAKGKPSS